MKGYHQFEYQWADPMLYERLKEFAKHNRKNPTDAEYLLWQHLRCSELGYTFKRQHIIGPFIVDFVCISIKLIIEIDGGYHQLPEQQISDQERTEWLEGYGFKIIRFTNEMILEDIDSVLASILDNIENFSNNQK